MYYMIRILYEKLFFIRDKRNLYQTINMNSSKLNNNKIKRHISE